MATIPREALDYVTVQINGLSADAQEKVGNLLAQLDWKPDDPENVAACRQAVVDALNAVMPTYTDAAAQASADFYDVSRELVVGEPLGAKAVSGYDPAKTEGAVRGFVRFALDGRVQTFNDQVLQRIDYEMKRSAGYCMTENAAADPLETRYARVPTGAETCAFCTMLASRGFVYHTRQSAGAMNHWHSGCDCRIVCAWQTKGAGVSRRAYLDLDVEGYDPDAYYDMWRKSEEMKERGIPAEQRIAVLAAMRDKLIPHYSAAPTDLVDLYQRGIDSAWKYFKSVGKTPDGYESTIGAFLADMGEASGARFSGEFMAKPDGNELWAATKLASEFENIKFRYADYRSPNPDFILDGEMAELKTPSSSKKVTNRLSDIPRQFAPYPDERRVGIISTIYLPNDVAYVKDTSQRFVDDGTLDEVLVIMPDGAIEHLAKQ